MAYKVRFDIPRRELGPSNVEFLIYKDGQAFGKLLVSKGAIVWRRPRKSKRGKKLGWTNFDKVFQEQGHSVKGG
jgi:hypothetical protein